MSRHSSSMYCLRSAAMFCMLAQLIVPISLASRRNAGAGVDLTVRASLIKPVSKTQQTQAQPQPSPDALKPFADFIKDAEVFRGLFTVYRKDAKVYIEILPDQFDQIYLCAPTMDSGLGERDFLSATALDANSLLCSGSIARSK